METDLHQHPSTAAATTTTSLCNSPTIPTNYDLPTSNVDDTNISKPSIQVTPAIHSTVTMAAPQAAPSPQATSRLSDELSNEATVEEGVPVLKRQYEAPVQDLDSKPTKRLCANPPYADDNVGLVPKKVNSEQWDNMFERLKAYKSENGDCLVPKRFAKDPRLGTWVETQASCRLFFFIPRASSVTR